MNMLAEAAKQAKSTDPVRVAQALSGMKFPTEFGEVEMRAADHQMIQPLFISTFVRSAAKGGPKDVRFDVENTGLAFRTDVRIEPYVSAQPTSCQMKRPGSSARALKRASRGGDRAALVFFWPVPWNSWSSRPSTASATVCCYSCCRRA
jgi:hypothetical protein